MTAQLIVNIMEYGSFGYSGGKLTERLRVQAFKAIMRQDMEFFDHPEHLPSLLTSNLAQDASLIQVEILDLYLIFRISWELDLEFKQRVLSLLS